MSCSAAIVADGLLRAELNTVTSQTHSKHLMGMIHTVCGMSKLKIAEMDGFAVTIGPGSFTGLRIGISTIKGLAWSLNKPVVGVSSLDAIAWQCAPSPYPNYCRYRFSGDELKKEGIEQVAPPDRVFGDIHEPCLFVGNGALLYKGKILDELGESAHFAGWNQHSIQASTVAGLSLARFRHQKTDDVALLVPQYIRKSDAELQLSKKS